MYGTTICKKFFLIFPHTNRKFCSVMFSSKLENYKPNREWCLHFIFKTLIDLELCRYALLLLTYICHDNFGSYFVIKLLLLRQKFMPKDMLYLHIYFRHFSCKNKLDLEHCIAFIVPCLFPLLLKLIAIDVLLV